MNRLILTLYIAMILPATATGATYFFDPVEKSLDQGEQFEANLMIDPESEFINAIEGSLKFPKRLLKVVEISTNDSLINAWIVKPHVEGSYIKFSGIIPGGFDGVRAPLESNELPGNLFTVTFEALRSGNGAVIFDEVVSLRNDGIGSEVLSSTIPLALAISNYPPLTYKNILTLAIILLAISLIIFKKIL